MKIALIIQTSKLALLTAMLALPGCQGADEGRKDSQPAESLTEFSMVSGGRR